MAALKRFFNRLHGLDNTGALLSSAGSAATRTLSFTNAPASLFTGLIVGFKANTDFDVDSTLNVNSLGAVNIQKMTASGYANIVAGDIRQNQHCWCKYDGTLAKFVLLNQIGFTDPLTTRGDLVVRGASATTRIAIGTANQVLQADGTDPSWIDPRAVASDYRTGTSATKYLTPDAVWDSIAEVGLTDAVTIAVDLSTGFDFTVTLGGNRTLGDPTNVKAGQKGRIRIVQDGTGSRTLAYGANWEFASGVAPTLSTDANAEDLLFYDCISATRIFASLVNDIS